MKTLKNSCSTIDAYEVRYTGIAGTHTEYIIGNCEDVLVYVEKQKQAYNVIASEPHLRKIPETLERNESVVNLF
ncbi:TPA: hypothetical protein DEP81_01330 [Candidatus Woesebacteria bacterium]|nr:hypothetical protein [Candidatus Woesebacteria bacterium]